MEKARFERANSKRPDLQSGAVGHFATSPDTKCLSTYPHEVEQVSRVIKPMITPLDTQTHPRVSTYSHINMKCTK